MNDKALIEMIARIVANMADKNMALDANNKPILYNDEAIAQSILAALRDAGLMVDNNTEWADKRDQWSDEIDAAHPLKTGDHKTRAIALEMVGSRHSKGALVDLVNWLLKKSSKLNNKPEPIGVYTCTNCQNAEIHEREVTCWSCGKGEMVFRRISYWKNMPTPIEPKGVR